MKTNIANITKGVGPSTNSGVLNEMDGSFYQQWGFEQDEWGLRFIKSNFLNGSISAEIQSDS